MFHRLDEFQTGIRSPRDRERGFSIRTKQFLKDDRFLEVVEDPSAASGARNPAPLVSMVAIMDMIRVDESRNLSECRKLLRSFHAL